MIKELILEANEIINKKCHVVFDGTEDSCESCSYSTRINYKSVCVLVEEMADKYKNKSN